MGPSGYVGCAGAVPPGLVRGGVEGLAGLACLLVGLV